MSSAVFIQNVARNLVDREVASSGRDRKSAVASVAHHLRVAPGSLANVIRARVKSISSDFRDAIVEAGIADISRQIERLEHERHILLQMGFNPSSDDMRIVEAALAPAREGIARMSRRA